jgi:hypothetical protein
LSKGYITLLMLPPLLLFIDCVAVVCMCAVQVKEILWQSIDILAYKLTSLEAGVKQATGLDGGQPMDQGYYQ